jgi:hypothetical protein
MFLRKLLWVTVVLLAPQIVLAAWEITSPAAMEDKDKDLTLVAKGEGEGDAESLFLSVYRGSTKLNDGTGSWPGGVGKQWSGSVAPPSPHFGTGEAVIKVWITGTESGDPLMSEQFNFID